MASPVRRPPSTPPPAASRSGCPLRSSAVRGTTVASPATSPCRPAGILSETNPGSITLKDSLGGSVAVPLTVNTAAGGDLADQAARAPCGQGVRSRMVLSVPAGVSSCRICLLIIGVMSFMSLAGFRVQGEAHPGGPVGVLGQFEHPGRAGAPGNDLELRPPGVEDGDAVVAVDPTATGPGENSPVDGSLAVSGRGVFDHQHRGAPLAIVSSVGVPFGSALAPRQSRTPPGPTRAWPGAAVLSPIDRRQDELPAHPGHVRPRAPGPPARHPGCRRAGSHCRTTAPRCATARR
jgi:hypothetical protein